MGKDNLNSISVVLPSFELKQPTQGDGYLTVAQNLLEGAEVLSNQKKIHPRSCALLAAHALECTLKAFLWHNGKQVVHGHDLLKLWKSAYEKKMPCISEDPPDWCKILSIGHGPNYYFRYQEGVNKVICHGGQYPELVSMTVELKKLLKVVEDAISK